MRTFAWVVWGLVACGGGKGGVPPDADAPSGDEVGRACASGVDVTAPTTLATPALDCPSRMCLHIEGESPDYCTATCTTASDCVESPAAVPCAGGYVCQPALSVGPFGCQNVCICADAQPLVVCS